MARRDGARASKPPYLDRSLDPDRRANDLLGRMTLEEKVRQMSMVARFGDLLANKRVSVAAMRRRYGKISPGCIDDPRLGPEATAEAVNAVQRYLVEETRLGIPAIVTGECLHGHMSGGTTVFPQAIGLASTWDVDLISEMGSVIAQEARVCGVSQALAPDLDLARDPRWGRVEETYGEDPYLVSRRVWLHQGHAGQWANHRPQACRLHGQTLCGSRQPGGRGQLRAGRGGHARSVHALSSAVRGGCERGRRRGDHERL